MNDWKRILLELGAVAVLGLGLAWALLWVFQWTEAMVIQFLSYVLLLLTLWAIISVVDVIIRERRAHAKRPSRADLDTGPTETVDDMMHGRRCVQAATEYQRNLFNPEIGDTAEVLRREPRHGRRARR
jgi:ABC-type siderophore export system fused ATPase/permease subunit